MAPQLAKSRVVSHRGIVNDCWITVSMVVNEHIKALSRQIADNIQEPGVDGLIRYIVITDWACSETCRWVNLERHEASVYAHNPGRILQKQSGAAFTPIESNHFCDLMQVLPCQT